MTIDVVLPAHNEGQTIERTLREFDQIVRQDSGISIRFVVCEDGSTDDTVEIVKSLSNELPIELISSCGRKGYSRAVVDGLRSATADIVAFIDSDGQCDPSDFAALYSAIEDADLVVGYRHPRSDPVYRKAMSRAFKLLYEVLFPVRLRDPSCPFLVVRRSSLEAILTGNAGLLKQGFWWEFNARAFASHVKVQEAPVRHRVRVDGKTKVYRIRQIPEIARAHVVALFALRRELRMKAGSEPTATMTLGRPNTRAVPEGISPIQREEQPRTVSH